LPRPAAPDAGFAASSWRSDERGENVAVLLAIEE
jgi:hypothetical protein